jgi:hypothetical protein
MNLRGGCFHYIREAWYAAIALRRPAADEGRSQAARIGAPPSAGGRGAAVEACITNGCSRRQGTTARPSSPSSAASPSPQRTQGTVGVDLAVAECGRVRACGRRRGQRTRVGEDAGHTPAGASPHRIGAELADESLARVGDVGEEPGEKLKGREGVCSGCGRSRLSDWMVTGCLQASYCNCSRLTGERAESRVPVRCTFVWTQHAPWLRPGTRRSARRRVRWAAIRQLRGAPDRQARQGRWHHDRRGSLDVGIRRPVSALEAKR